MQAYGGGSKGSELLLDSSFQQLYLLEEKQVKLALHQIQRIGHLATVVLASLMLHFQDMLENLPFAGTRFYRGVLPVLSMSFKIGHVWDSPGELRTWMRVISKCQQYVAMLCD